MECCGVRVFGVFESLSTGFLLVLNRGKGEVTCILG